MHGGVNRLANRGLRKLRELHFNQAASAVLDTPPVRAAANGADDGLVIFSMIGTAVLFPYLIAAKSLHVQLGYGRFAVLDDGTLTASDKRVLREHLDDPVVYAIAEVEVGDCPRGGCWERLLTLLELRRDAYVIQLDSDTVTLGAVPEVVAAIARGRNFSLRGEADSEWLPVAQIGYDFATLPASAHVQARIEALLERVEVSLPQVSHYARACAGFAGFAPGGHTRELADAFSREAVRLLGAAAWAQWGSEQVMSNVIVSNEGKPPLLLPYDRYLNYWAEPELGDAALVHFIGTYRYHRGTYRQAARQAIAALQG